jgi:hypothetical protein
MTTIACNRQEMACDSRTSFESGEFFTCDDKIERVGQALIGCAGDVGAIFKFLAWYRNQDRDRPEFTEDEKFDAVALTKDGIYYFAGCAFGCKVIQPFFSIGSGAMAAKAAMLCDKSPAEAVAIAVKCDKNTAAPVRVVALKGG